MNERTITTVYSDSKMTWVRLVLISLLVAIASSLTLVVIALALVR